MARICAQSYGVVVDRTSAWQPNVGSCAYLANILLRPNVKIILLPNLPLRPFFVIIFGFGQRWFSDSIHLYILGVTCTGQYNTRKSYPAYPALLQQNTPMVMCAHIVRVTRW